MIVKRASYKTQKLNGQVQLRGKKIAVENWSVEIPAHDETDTFRLKVPWAVGGDGVLASNDKVNTFLIAEKDVPCKIHLNNRELISGLVDEPNWSFGLSEDSIEISGSGRIGRMVERELIRNVKNRTASSVAGEIFKHHKINAIIKGTSVKIGAYSADSQSSDTEMNDWQLLHWLAEWEGYVVRVVGNTGYFGPPEELPELKKKPIKLTYGHNCEIQSLGKRKSGIRDLIIEGRSYHNRRTVVEYYPRKPKKENETGIIKRYYLTGLSPEQLRKRIKAIYGQFTKYDLVGRLIIPEYLEVLPDRKIELGGLGKDLSGIYYTTKVIYTEDVESITTEIEISNKLLEVSP
ncbi:hypothetical protein FZD47_25285 [Bacillus infantis]|uniref:Uncharacterized protein n=1 Tax=Bacillus infantis TaxID=324767 RepID=A0A5D4S132_9BACI|nr:hypothetical protein [Bacillus infantis]TYS55744.1 hypothetical protein FZD47_25285 [Bacillus infantis]